MKCYKSISRRSVLSLALLGAFVPSSSLAQENVSKELRNVKAYFKQNPSELRAAQQHLKTMGAYAGKADGRWGAGTERAFKNVLENYIAIGGRGSDWGVNKPSDTRRFVTWIASANHANETGTDYPD
jgi:hypothetical protein